MAHIHITTSVQARTRRALLLSLLASVLLLGCSALSLGPVGTPTPDPQIAGLLARPESQFTYSGAVELASDTQGRTPGQFGVHASSVARKFGIPAAQSAQVTPDVLFAWYDQQLAPLGWNVLESGKISFFSAERDWTNGGYRLLLGIYEKSEVTRLMPWIDQTVYPIVFEASFADYSGKP